MASVISRCCLSCSFAEYSFLCSALQGSTLQKSRKALVMQCCGWSLQSFMARAVRFPQLYMWNLAGACGRNLAPLSVSLMFQWPSHTCKHPHKSLGEKLAMDVFLICFFMPGMSGAVRYCSSYCDLLDLFGRSRNRRSSIGQVNL